MFCTSHRHLWSYSRFKKESRFLGVRSTFAQLGGGFKYFLCSTLIGEMIQFDYIIFFQMGWFNHQFVNCFLWHFGNLKNKKQQTDFWGIIWAREYWIPGSLGCPGWRDRLVGKMLKHKQPWHLVISKTKGEEVVCVHPPKKTLSSSVFFSKKDRAPWIKRRQTRCEAFCENFCQQR